MSPAQVHTWHLSADTAGYVVFFTLESYALENNRHQLADFPFFHLTAAPFVSIDTSHQQTVETIFVHLFQEYNGHEVNKEAIISAYLTILLIKLSNSYGKSHKPITSSHLQQQIRKLETLIEQYYLDHKPATEYAQLLNISAKQLNTICQQALSKPLSIILQERIILEAKRLLVHTDQTVTQIADQLNYVDNSYFNRIFKKKVGLTPEQFRKHFK